MEDKNKEFEIRSKLECLYVFLDRLEAERIEKIFAIDFYKRKLLTDVDFNDVKNDERQVNLLEDDKKERDAKIRITKKIIEEEKANVSPEEQEKIFKNVCQRLERLYITLQDLRQGIIQRDLDILYWEKRIKSETNEREKNQLLADLTTYKEDKKEKLLRSELINKMIEEEKASLDKEMLAKNLEKVKMMSPEDMVRSVVDFFIMSTVPYEVDQRFWESKLVSQPQEEVVKAIQTQALPNVKKSIKLNNGGKENAEEYLKTLQAQPKEEKEVLAN